MSELEATGALLIRFNEKNGVVDERELLGAASAALRARCVALLRDIHDDKLVDALLFIKVGKA